MQGRQYKNPSIVEALVEFRFAGDEQGAWNDALPMRVWEKLRAEYPKSRGPQIVMSVSPQGIGAKFERLLLADERDRFLAGIGEHAISVHALPRYPGWDELRPRVLAAMETYDLESKTRGVNRISVRFINRIDLPSGAMLTAYFTAPPVLPSPEPSGIGQFATRVEAPYLDGAGLVFNFNSAPASPAGLPGVILDIELLQDFATPIDLKSAYVRLDVLRDRERSMFEAAITDKTRELMDQ